MKFLTITIAVLLLAAGALESKERDVIGQASTDRLPSLSAGNARDYLGGQASPLIFTCPAETLDHSTGTEVATQWLQIGWSPSFITGLAEQSNKNAQKYGSRNFTAIVELDTIKTGTIDGDSLGCYAMRWELAYDTTASVIVPHDSSHLFMADGNFTHPRYGLGGFYEEMVKNVLATWEDKPRSFILAVPHGAFIRFVATPYKENFDGSGGNGMTEKTKLMITFICEN